MRCLALLVPLVLASLALVACDETKPTREMAIAGARRAKAEYEKLAGSVVASLPVVAAPLEGLNEEQMASVAGLLVMTRVAARNEGVGSLHSAPLTNGYWAEIADLCPPLPNDLDSKLPGCLGPEVEYASSMAECLKERCPEDEPGCEALCERVHAGKLSAAVACRMEEIDAMRGVIQKITGRPWPPGTFPWPGTDPRPTE
jgi:hypothetical protein